MGLDNAATWSKTGLNLGHGYGPLMLLLPSAGRNAFRISALFPGSALTVPLDDVVSAGFN